MLPEAQVTRLGFVDAITDSYMDLVNMPKAGPFTFSEAKGFERLTWYMSPIVQPSAMPKWTGMSDLLKWPQLHGVLLMAQ